MSEQYYPFTDVEWSSYLTSSLHEEPKMVYHVLLEKKDGFTARCKELPEVTAKGRSEDEVLKSVITSIADKGVPAFIIMLEYSRIDITRTK